jgi:hypothetical protein
MRIVLALLALVFFSGLAQANGEVIERYDPDTGVVLPGKPTAARIDSEKLTVEFVPDDDRPTQIRRVDVEAEYRISNPTDTPLNLDIGFPLPGGGAFGEFIGPPVRLDGKPIDWRLISYEELLKPLKPTLVRAMRRWTKRHPEAVKLVAEMDSLQQQSWSKDRREREEALRTQLRAEMSKAGGSWHESDPIGVLRSDVGERFGTSQDLWELERAIRLTGQRNLLPEGRWHIDPEFLDPATGREVWGREGVLSGWSVALLTFSIQVRPRGTHELRIRYRQTPSHGEEYDDPSCRFRYILETAGGWASFGPIDVTVNAPSALVLRSLPKLQESDARGRTKTYRATLRDPGRNLQVVLTTREMLLPRLKVNGRWNGGRYDMLVGDTIVVPRNALPGPITVRMLQGDVTITRRYVTVRVTPGQKRMLVFGESKPLSAPVVVRRGVSYLPAEVIQALYPESNVTLTYHKPSRTVLLGIKPPPLQ